MTEPNVNTEQDNVEYETVEIQQPEQKCTFDIFRKTIIVAATVALIVVILYAFGFIGGEKIQPDQTAAGLVPEKIEKAGESRARKELITEWYAAVGTIRPLTETTVGAQTTGRVVEVLVRSGDAVTPGQDLIKLDSREFAARVDQARQGLESARARQQQAREAISASRAEFDRAQSEFSRFKRLYDTGATSSRSFEQARASFLAAQAGLNQAQDGLSAAEAGVIQAEKQLEEAEVALSYNTIKAVEDGQVVKRLVEPGDMASPGKPLLVLQTSKSLLLEAMVREGLIQKVQPGTRMKTSIDALNLEVEGVVNEVVPSADPQTRTFLVKVAVEALPGLYPGMFGRLLIPVDEQKVVVIPQNAVRRIGQLEVVRIKDGETWRDVYVRTGRALGGDVEVLSGLSGEETIAIFKPE